MNTELYSNNLRKIATLVTSNPSPEDIFVGLHTCFKNIIRFEELKFGLLSSTQKNIDWVFLTDNDDYQFTVSSSKLKPLFKEALSKERTVAEKDEEGLVDICSPIRLYSQNLGIIEIKTTESKDLPKLLEFLDLVSSYISFIFIDLKIKDEKLVRQSIVYERDESVNQLNQKLLSIIDVARSLAHELNQPLTGISGYCTLIMESLENDDSLNIMNDLQKILEQASRLESLIFKFQSVAHIEGRKNKIVL